jgi:hypothetical protein
MSRVGSGSTRAAAVCRPDAPQIGRPPRCHQGLRHGLRAVVHQERCGEDGPVVGPRLEWSVELELWHSPDRDTSDDGCQIRSAARGSDHLLPRRAGPDYRRLELWRQHQPDVVAQPVGSPRMRAWRRRRPRYRGDRPALLWSAGTFRCSGSPRASERASPALSRRLAVGKAPRGAGSRWRRASARAARASSTAQASGVRRACAGSRCPVRAPTS